MNNLIYNYDVKKIQHEGHSSAIGINFWIIVDLQFVSDKIKFLNI